MKYLKKIFSNEVYVKRITYVTVIIISLIVTFFTYSLFDFYKSNIKYDGVKLYYEFGPNTLSYNFDEEAASMDISEKFLSYGISYGIDVSEWQGEIDWNKVKATGISFAIIRCGFRQTHGSEVKEDQVFRKNVERATAAGLKVGVYFFGTAASEEEAIEEALFTVDLIKDYNITYPVVYDIETFNEGRLKNVSYSTITDNVLAFTETVGSYGYETMVYSYHNALSYMLDTGKFDGKLIWLAHYADRTNYKGNYNMWQYTSEGKVDGINTKVDLNVSYFTYVDDESKIVPNPFYVSAPEVEFTNEEERVRIIRDTTARTGPTSEIPNKLGTIKKGTVTLRTGKSERFSRIIFEGREVYVLNDDVGPMD